LRNVNRALIYADSVADNRTGYLRDSKRR
jgi:hypothetical protein